MSELDQLLLDSRKSSEPTPLVFVRLTTSYWYDHSGINIKQTLRFLKRKCEGHNFIEEDCSMIGAAEVVPRIINLGECKDGVYQVITCNERGSDWEMSHIIDEYDYMLIEVK